MMAKAFRFNPNNEPPYLNPRDRRPINTNLLANNPFALSGGSRSIDPYAQRNPNLGPYFGSQPVYQHLTQQGLRPAPNLGLGPSMTMRPVDRPFNSSLFGPRPQNYNDFDWSRPDRDIDLDRNYTSVWRKANLPCSTSSSSCHTNRAGSYNFATKDIVVRGQARVIRASYLSENTKFEADLIKYLDKKDTSQVPERVVDMLISFINEDSYDCRNALDEVTLNILAHNIGAKSVVDVSLKKLKDVRVELDELGSITATILLSNKVDKNLTDWLKKYLERDGNWGKLDRLRSFTTVAEDRPELYVEVERLLEFRKTPRDTGFRSL